MNILIVVIFIVGFSMPSYAEENLSPEIQAVIQKAKEGDISAQLNLGLKYYSGSLGIPKDLKKSIHWYTKASETGDMEAQYMLATIYYDGTDVPKDHEKAFKWYFKAAQKGHIDAQLNVAGMYNNGEGVTKDYTEAFKWFVEAARNGNYLAQYLVAGMYAGLYEDGKLVEHDYKKAYAWYKISERNFPDAKIEKEEIEKLLNKESMAEAKALAEEFYKLYVKPFEEK